MEKTLNWGVFAAVAAALGIAGGLFFLYRKGRIKSTDLGNIAALIDRVGDALEGKPFVSLFADYAAKAVRVVEQMVKNGEMERDNALRKNEAKAIVERLALTDGVSLDVVHDNEAAIGDLIEAAVNEMQSNG